ncbi:hypothetical protein EJ04DRAFT_439784 [Polyplosphaeria fusca]|uniref:DUF7820 domain-containing protein n=1 Tax=Polyplosphaeria fusca TaxID=682080 RepID=A0A9P4QSM6_9PLEO|nr:hypothetical protein EJ04DRAFT_439784 [Polyplosphaeria fusca]
MDRRSSDDGRTPLPANPNVFDDEYALDPSEDNFMPGVADGFRPANLSEGWTGDRNDHDRDGMPRPPLPSSKSADSTDLRRIASRNSTMKPPNPRDSTSHDARHPGTHARASSQAAGLQHRASISSTGSFATTARSDSPLNGGPSHPYGMYTQNTMVRTSSVTTSSTARQPHRSMSLQRPAHPYGMYTQNVDETPDEPAMQPAPVAIPVGFPGLNTGFHRRIGPDGEEQDIIGPDGHTEQLPPYSRYPAEGPTKAALAAEAAASPVNSTPTSLPLSASDDALISSTDRQTPQQSTQNGDAASSQGSSPEMSEKTETARKRDTWRNKRLWGKIPLGIGLILLIVVIVCAIIMGAAIGTVVARNKDEDKNGRKGGRGGHGEDEASPQVTGPSPTLFDATVISKPTDVPALPSGVFALPLGIPQESNPGCLTQANQYAAWSCKMSFAPLVLTINDTAANNDGNSTIISIQGIPKPDSPVQYGIQAPALPMQGMRIVADLDYVAYGPAYHFQTLYDKVVVLNYDDFAAGSGLRVRDKTSRKRDGDKPQYRQRFQVLPGDTPWFCYWNQTFIEGYIYAKDNSSAATRTDWPSAWYTNTYTSTPVASSVPAAATGYDGSPATTAPAGSPVPTPLARRGDSDYPHYSAYPRIVKIEERRLPGAPQPFCVKKRLLDNGIMVEEQNNGKTISVPLQELDPTIEDFLVAGGPPPPDPSATASGNNTAKRALQKRTDPAQACHCQWMFQ